ncbi:hypothetical protein [Salinibacterium sp. GXW1014]|uniref:hypothetical protein n=1 Tax=Salinibacterium sp. GXW1014 TaxID=3377838 RepID=UPI00383B1C68
MQPGRATHLGRAILCGFAVAALAGCSTMPPAVESASPQPPSPSVVSEETLQEQSLVGTSWRGMDSAGDRTSFTLEPDHTVVVAFNDGEWHDPRDTWQLDAGVLTITVHVDAVHGDLVYRADYAASADTLEATATSTLSERTLTVTLERS